MIKKIMLLFILIFIISSFIFAQNNEAQDNRYTMKIVVVGPGDELYLWWGHIALIIEDSVTGRNSLYDYGQFSFEQDNFFTNFAIGRLYYNCGVSDADAFLFYNSLDNRDIIIYTLDVPQYKCVEVKTFAENNVLPENKYYEYHHFKDNCSTRIRDIIDIITDGQFSERYKETPGRYTLRQHVRRHTWFSPFTDWILNFWMGQVIDTPITIWEEMFLPSEVGKIIEGYSYIDLHGVNRKLVTDIEIYNKAENRPAVLEVPRKQWPRQLVFSLALSIIFGVFFFMMSKNIKAGRVLAGISISLCSLVFGFAALLLYFMSIFTNHDYTYSNLNMLFCSPILLAAVPLGLKFAFTKNPEKKLNCDIWLRLIWLLTVIGILISMILKILPWAYQQNLTDIMLILPIALVFVFQPVGLKDSAQKVLQNIITSLQKIQNKIQGQ